MRNCFYPILAAAAIAAMVFFPAIAKQSLQASHIYETPFKDKEGIEVRLDSFKRNVVLLNLWATWCSPCVEEMPALSKLQDHFFGRGLKVVTVSQDNGVKAIEGFFARHKIDNLPVFIDDKMKLLKAVGAKGLPVTVLFDRKGNEIKRYNGYVNWEDKNRLEEIERLLK